MCDCVRIFLHVNEMGAYSYKNILCQVGVNWFCRNICVETMLLDGNELCGLFTHIVKYFHNSDFVHLLG